MAWLKLEDCLVNVDTVACIGLINSESDIKNGHNTIVIFKDSQYIKSSQNFAVAQKKLCELLGVN